MDGYRKVQTARDISGLFALLGVFALCTGLIGGPPGFFLAAVALFLVSAYFHTLARKRKSALEKDEN